MFEVSEASKRARRKYHTSIPKEDTKLFLSVSSEQPVNPFDSKAKDLGVTSFPYAFYSAIKRKLFWESSPLDAAAHDLNTFPLGGALIYTNADSDSRSNASIYKSTTILGGYQFTKNCFSFQEGCSVAGEIKTIRSLSNDIGKDANLIAMSHAQLGIQVILFLALYYPYEDCTRVAVYSTFTKQAMLLQGVKIEGGLFGFSACEISPEGFQAQSEEELLMGISLGSSGQQDVSVNILHIKSDPETFFLSSKLITDFKHTFNYEQSGNQHSLSSLASWYLEKHIVIAIGTSYGNVQLTQIKLIGAATQDGFLCTPEIHAPLLIETGQSVQVTLSNLQLVDNWTPNMLFTSPKVLVLMVGQGSKPYSNTTGKLFSPHVYLYKINQQFLHYEVAAEFSPSSVEGLEHTPRIGSVLGITLSKSPDLQGDGDVAMSNSNIRFSVAFWMKTAADKTHLECHSALLEQSPNSFRHTHSTPPLPLNIESPPLDWIFDGMNGLAQVYLLNHYNVSCLGMKSLELDEFTHDLIVDDNELKKLYDWRTAFTNLYNEYRDGISSPSIPLVDSTEAANAAPIDDLSREEKSSFLETFLGVIFPYDEIEYFLTHRKMLPTMADIIDSNTLIDPPALAYYMLCSICYPENFSFMKNYLTKSAAYLIKGYLALDRNMENCLYDALQCFSRGLSSRSENMKLFFADKLLARYFNIDDNYHDSEKFQMWQLVMQQQQMGYTIIPSLSEELLRKIMKLLVKMNWHAADNLLHQTLNRDNYKALKRALYEEFFNALFKPSPYGDCAYLKAYTIPPPSNPSSDNDDRKIDEAEVQLLYYIQNNTNVANAASRSRAITFYINHLTTTSRSIQARQFFIDNLDGSIAQLFSMEQIQSLDNITKSAVDTLHVSGEPLQLAPLLSIPPEQDSLSSNSVSTSLTKLTGSDNSANDNNTGRLDLLAFRDQMKQISQRMQADYFHQHGEDYKKINGEEVIVRDASLRFAKSHGTFGPDEHLFDSISDLTAASHLRNNPDHSVLVDRVELSGVYEQSELANATSSSFLEDEEAQFE